MSANGTAGFVALLLAVGASESEAVAVCNRFAGTVLPHGPQALLDMANLLLGEVRGEGPDVG